MTRLMKFDLTTLVWTTICCTLTLFWAAAAPAFNNNWQEPKAGDYQKAPPFTSYSVTPNVMIILDNSDSMNYYAYEEYNAGSGSMTYTASNFEGESYANPSHDYYGIFNSRWFYTYNEEANRFEVKYKKKSFDAADNSWTVVSTDNLDSDTGQVIGNADIINIADPSQGLWDGNWLNWISMRRIDILRKVLVGGNTRGERTDDGQQTIYAREDSKSWTRVFSSNGRAAVCPFSGSQSYQIVNGLIQRQAGMNQWGNSYQLNVLKQQIYEPEDFDSHGNLVGVLQKAGDQAFWGNMWFDERNPASPQGGQLSNPLGSPLDQLVADLESKVPSTRTPLAETYCTVIQYFEQSGNILSTSNYSVNRGGAGDPYYQLDADGNYTEVPCRQSYVLMLTDGASTNDQDLPDRFKVDWDRDGNEANNSRSYTAGGSDYLDDVALYAHTTDLRDDLDGDQTLTLYTVYAFGNDQTASNLLKDAATNGGFKDLPGGTNGAIDGAAEWDSNGDGTPDNYFEANDGYLLEEQIKRILNAVKATAASGTAASVVSNSSSGEGAVYQSIFYPELKDEGNGISVKWVGKVYALFADAYGNLREDSDGNATLNLDDDLFLEFTTAMEDGVEQTVVSRYQDSDADGQIDLTAGGDWDNFVDTVPFRDVNYLWSSDDWLNSTDLDPVSQRAYKSAENKRYIFTFVDKNNDMAMPEDNGERMDFVAGNPEWNTLVSPDSYYAYIHAYDQPFTQTTPESQDVVAARIQRVINFVRGQDQTETTVDGTTLTASRSRQFYNSNGQMETLRLGDIVYSSPTVVSQPAENYDLLYRDKTYAAFVSAHLNRRHVVYVGANDGMLHAFNGGFYDSDNKRFTGRPLNEEGNEDGSITDYPLGAELWAYVPFNLLPHLHWLANPDYEHVYYVDLEPRVFDAKVYSGKGSGDAVNPYGWATLMVVGMRFGGGKIAADIDKTDGAYDPDEDKVMSSAYAIFDITNPEDEPKLLAEVNFPRLGFTTCHPGVVPLRTLDENNEADGDDNKWYLVFGSGPISTTDTTTITGDLGANNDALIDGTSSQKAVLYALDLVQLVNNHKVYLRKSSGGVDLYNTADENFMVAFDEEKSSVSKPIAVDWDLDFNTDAVYFGTSFGDYDNGWSGRLRRWVTNANAAATDSIMLDLSSGDNLHQPITAAPTAGIDSDGNRWIYIGTGRFMSEKDKLSTDQQTFYGVKEPLVDSGDDGNLTFTYGQVPYIDLEDVSDIDITEDQTNNEFTDTRDMIEEKSGWRMDFLESGERNLGQAVLMGGILTFTTYKPSEDLCDATGSSYLYALHYLTGTAYYKDIIGTYELPNGERAVSKRYELGSGITVTPNIQVGRGDSVRTFIQTGKGGIKHLEETNLPGRFKSGRSYWMPDIEECPDSEPVN